MNDILYDKYSYVFLFFVVKRVKKYVKLKKRLLPKMLISRVKPDEQRLHFFVYCGKKKEIGR